jgi:chromosome segregation ATPase
VSVVIDKYKEIISSAGDFDSFVKNKLAQMQPIEIELSLRISNMIKEAESELARRLENHNRIVSEENNRLSIWQKRLDDLNNDLGVKSLNISLQESLLAQQLEKYHLDIHNLKNAIEEYKEKWKAVKEKEQKLEFQENEIRKDLSYINDSLKSIEQEKKDIVSAYSDIEKQRKEISEKLELIKEAKVDEKLKAIEKTKSELETKQEEISKQKLKIDEGIVLLDTKKKDHNDREINLKAWQAELERQWGKFKEEVNNFKQEKQNG